MRLIFEETLDLAKVYHDKRLTEIVKDAYFYASNVAETNGIGEQYEVILIELARF